MLWVEMMNSFEKREIVDQKRGILYQKWCILQGDPRVYRRPMRDERRWADEHYPSRAAQVSFQWKNPDFLLRNPDFLLKNVVFVI